MALTLQQKLIINDYLAGCAGAEFRWSYNDCNTLLIKMLDKLNNTKYYETKIEGQYNTRKTARQFQQKLGLTPAQWLHINKYRKLEGEWEWEDGDVAIIQHKIYASTYIYFNRVFWTVPENRELITYDPDAVTKALTSGWRYNG